MVVVFALGLCISTLMERRTEIKSTLINHKTVIGKLEARNEGFKNDYPREYRTWSETAKTDLQRKFNGSVGGDPLED